MAHTTIALTTGDYNGIGPEVVIKALQEEVPSHVTPLLVGAPEIFDYYCDRLQLPLPYHTIKSIDELKPGSLNLLDCISTDYIDISPGETSKQAGSAAMQSIEKAMQLCVDGQAGGMVTAPISKEAVNMAGYSIPGHTEFLAHHSNSSDYMMMLVNDELRVGLVSIHDPLRSVIDRITEANILRNVRIMHKALSDDFGIASPTIAVLGLNPHAGDGGYIGKEEIEIISPALQKAQFDGINAQGPFAADGFFGNRHYPQFDGILAMYHDQGLVPFKTLSFNAGVNFTAGLSIIRTSPDHGTAFNIAGKNKASFASYRKAFDLAVRLAGSG